MTDVEGLTALVSIGSAFVGSALGTLVTLALARRSAREQAMGEHFARRKMELIEGLSKVVAQSWDTMDVFKGMDIGPNYGTEHVDLVRELAVLLDSADLYVSEDVIAAVRPTFHWMLDPTPATIPESPTYDEIRRLLRQASRGDHEPESEIVRDIRRKVRELKKPKRRSFKGVIPKQPGE